MLRYERVVYFSWGAQSQSEVFWHKSAAPIFRSMRQGGALYTLWTPSIPDGHGAPQLIRTTQYFWGLC